MAVKTDTSTAKKGKKMENTLATTNSAPALFEYKAIKPGSFFDLSAITDESLKNDTIALETIVFNAKESGERLSKSAAKVVGRIYSCKSYVKSNFKSLEAYAKTVGLINETTSKAAVYQLAFAGCIYNDETLPYQLRSLPIAHLSIIKSAFENKKHPEYKAQIIADAPALFDGITVKQMKEYVDKLTAKPVVIDTFVQFNFPIKPGEIVNASTDEAETMEAIDGRYKDNKDVEFLVIKAIKTNFGDTKIEFPRRLLVSGDNYKLFVYVPKAHIEQRKRLSPSKQGQSAYNAIRVGAFIDGGVISLLTEKDVKDFVENPDAQGLTETRIAFIKANFPGILDESNGNDENDE